MYILSKEAISEVDGVISESDKLNLINTYFSSDKVRNSEFFEEYYKYYRRIKDTPAYALDISEIEVRHIRSVDIIPKELYYENEERYESILKQIEPSLNRPVKSTVPCARTWSSSSLSSS